MNNRSVTTHGILNLLTPVSASRAPVFARFFDKPDELPSSGDEALKLCALDFDERYVCWALQNLPVAEARQHFLVSGIIGSGKTIAIQLFLQSIAPRFHAGAAHPEQLIIFDAKGDVVSRLAALGLGPDAPNVWILNPFDARSAVWDLSEALDSPAMARNFASLVIPEEKGSTAPFFTNAARELIIAVIIALNEVAPARWTLRDLLCALESLERIEAVTARHPRAQVMAARYLADKQHVPSVLSTVASKMGSLEAVAALWHTNGSGRRFSIEKFLAAPGTLILGNDPVLRESYWPINAIMLKALTQEILRRSETPGLRHWFVLDEFRAMQRVDCVRDLLNLGRSKGVSVLLGIQDLEGLIEIYDEHVANGLLSQCTQKMFLRAGGPKTAEWAERFFGKVRRVETTVTKSKQGWKGSESEASSLQERSLFLASFFLDLPLPRLGQDYVAVCDEPWRQVVTILRHPFEEVLSWCRPPSAVANVIPRPNKDQCLLPWTEAEEACFCGGLSDLSQMGLGPEPIEPNDDYVYLPQRPPQP